MNDQAQKLRELAKNKDLKPDPVKRASHRCRSIAITSGKGGVGKSTLSLTLAGAIQKLQKKVLLMDVDLGLANVHILLGMAPRYNISHFISGECALNDVVMRTSGGIALVPGASGLEELANMDASRLERLRVDFMGLEESYDFLVMDTGAGIGSTVTHFSSHADLTLLVMSPDPTSLADAYAMVKVLYEKGATRIGVVVNMASNDREGSETFDRLNALVVKFLKKPLELFGVILSDKEIQRFGRMQNLLKADSTHNRFVHRTTVLARKICGCGIAEKSSFFSRFFGRINSGV
ncbi:MAG: MinD/ParA family protein [Chitinispirillaceae bacterium]